MPNASRLSGALLLACLVAGCDSDPTATAAFLTSTFPSVDFGRRDVTSAPVARAIHIQNTGGTASGALGVSITGPGAAGFRIDTAASSCIGQRLGANAGCDVAVRLEGQASGPLAATLVVGAGAGSQSALVALAGILVSKLNVYYQGTGHGTVTESAHGTSCIATCTLDLDVPTVTLTAVPDPQSNFVGWTGAPGCGTSSTCTMTLVDLNAVTVKFDPIP
ncbi:MAG: hypothetical protein HOQ11_13815 [Gemmatimonadaceae bacterium]|nr:hypothetical protein [Gemmatimonadaceae bacterium]NUQ92125.1 hypothetical protein [Gemmatimonadaceae bacterium]NUR21208.1 hypothetical protein [Gemmatimonadaceae bacterium]NUS98477.1 hypothetical protein [Gemmatimonadaceae bacterium]